MVFKDVFKGHELQKRKLSKELDIPELQDFADKALRIELTLRSLELKERGCILLKDGHLILL